jgi:scyllo-inositol 2-dehydrogenase (NADP+)
MRVIPVGLLGYGFAGSVFAAPVIRAVPGLVITKVMTTRADDLARDLPQAQAAATADEIFADPAIELVVVETPNPTHFDLARRALEAGKHVVVDKPMTTTVAEADELIAVAAERKRILSVYQNRRWDNDFLTLRSLADAGRLGHIYGYEAHYDRFRPAIKPGWRERPQPGSGALFDLGSHLIDQALTLFGLPETVLADVITQRPEARVDDYFHLILGYRDRRAILHASTIVREPGPHFAVHGDAGSFLMYGLDPQEADLKAGRRVDAPDWGRDGATATYVAADGTRETIPALPGAYQAYYAGIAAAIEGNGPVPVTAQAGRDVIAVIECAARSSAERRTIAF